MASLVADAQQPTSPKLQPPNEAQEGDLVIENPQHGANKRSAPGKKEQKTTQGDTKESKLSGAELKKRAKEEKAARRAKEKQGMQMPNQSVAPTHAQQAPSTPSTAQSTGNAITKQDTKQQKRRGSATAPKQLPIRTTEPQAAAVAPVSKKESKNVAMFSHLYGQPRRTSMAGAGKDIHPAVVTLGLKMSHYIILGSNARCVAMLLAFERVSIYSDMCMYLAKGV